jgi:hypothetical protein
MSTKVDITGIDWDNITWDEFRAQKPEVSKSTFYNLMSQHKKLPVIINPVDAPTETIEQGLTEVQKKIIGRLMAGELESQSAELEGVSVAEHLMWLNNPEKFGAKYPEAVKKGIQVARQRIKDRALSEIQSWGKKQWQSQAWVLERLFPAEFGKPEPGTGHGTVVNVGIKLQVRDRKGKDISANVKVS